MEDTNLQVPFIQSWPIFGTFVAYLFRPPKEIVDLLHYSPAIRGNLLIFPFNQNIELETLITWVRWLRGPSWEIMHLNFHNLVPSSSHCSM